MKKILDSVIYLWFDMSMLQDNHETRNFTREQIARSRRDLTVYRLKVSGYSLSALAKELKVHTQDVCKTLSNQPYPRIERRITEIISERPERLWPDRYDSEGRSLRRVGRPPKIARINENGKANGQTEA